MDVLGSSKKKWWIIGTILGVIIITSLFILINHLKDNKNEVVQEPEIDEGEQEWQEDDFIYENLYPSQPTENERVQVAIPTKVYGGTASDFEENGSRTTITLNVGGDESRQQKFSFNAGGIVFDASINKAVRPSLMKEAESVTIVSSGQTYGESYEVADVVILNNKDGLQFTPVHAVEYSEQSITVKNEVSLTKYIIPEDTKTINALNGREFDKSNLSTGDRLFVYGKLKDNKSEVIESSEVEDDVIPEDIVSTDNNLVYTTYEVSELYVYPSKDED